jgi:lysophospholipase L1-like esterase
LAILTVVAAADPAPSHVVVLGSSTAAGAGASHPDSAWVRRYERNIQSLNPGNQVTNLALGGYTTYHIQPTGSAPPPGRPSPDPARNITQALSLTPDHIIINLPSNDAASGYTVAEQLANYDSVLARASAQGVPVWVATTQPRNLSTAGRANLMEMRDSTFARFGAYAVDFWSTLALPGGTIDPACDSGDGIHLNDDGHRILFERMAAEGIFGETAVDAEVPSQAAGARRVRLERAGEGTGPLDEGRAAR